MNPQGKMPLLVTEQIYCIPESDTISRFLIDKYQAKGPSFVPNDLIKRSLSEQIVRLHDIYISPIQGCMYRAPGSVFSTFGSNRNAALAEVRRQLSIIESLVVKFNPQSSSSSSSNPFLCGDEISLAGNCEKLLSRQFSG